MKEEEYPNKFYIKVFFFFSLLKESMSNMCDNIFFCLRVTCVITFFFFPTEPTKVLQKEQCSHLFNFTGLKFQIKK